MGRNVPEQRSATEPAVASEPTDRSPGFELVLQRWQPVHLPPPGTPRHEVKFVAPPSALPQMEGWLRAHHAGWQIDHPDRTVSNVYFDSPTLAAWNDNHDGNNLRRKLRLRWYGERWHVDRATLEAKCRAGRVGWKWHAQVTAPIDLAHWRWQRVHDQLRHHLPPAFRLLLEEQPLASLVNRYRRQYFVSRDRQLRLTIDRDLRVWPQLGHARPSLGRPAHKVDALVVEVKCAIEAEQLAAEALATIPLRVGRHSKYALGIESLQNL